MPKFELFNRSDKTCNISATFSYESQIEGKGKNYLSKLHMDSKNKQVFIGSLNGRGIFIIVEGTKSGKVAKKIAKEAISHIPLDSGSTYSKTFSFSCTERGKKLRCLDDAEHQISEFGLYSSKSASTDKSGSTDRSLAISEGDVVEEMLVVEDEDSDYSKNKNEGSASEFDSFSINSLQTSSAGKLIKELGVKATIRYTPTLDARVRNKKDHLSRVPSDHGMVFMGSLKGRAIYIEIEGVENARDAKKIAKEAVLNFARKENASTVNASSSFTCTQSGKSWSLEEEGSVNESNL